jgi:hypothetical protein
MEAGLFTCYIYTYVYVAVNLFMHACRLLTKDLLIAGLSYVPYVLPDFPVSQGTFCMWYDHFKNNQCSYHNAGP